MKIAIVWMLGAVLLAGCATGPSGVRLSELERDIHLRDQRRLPMDFAKIQMALFKHQRLCGSAPVFAVVPNHPSHATVTLKEFPGAGWGDTILVNMLLLANLTVTTKTYTYHPGQRERIDQLFNAITHPDVCPGQKKKGPEPAESESAADN
jgi:N-acyl-D-aspartate/D-glutamate deacylase